MQASRQIKCYCSGPGENPSSVWSQKKDVRYWMGPTGHKQECVPHGLSASHEHKPPQVTDSSCLWPSLPDGLRLKPITLAEQVKPSCCKNITLRCEWKFFPEGKKKAKGTAQSPSVLSAILLLLSCLLHAFILMCVHMYICATVHMQRHRTICRNHLSPSSQRVPGTQFRLSTRNRCLYVLSHPPSPGYPLWL